MCNLCNNIHCDELVKENVKYNLNIHKNIVMILHSKVTDNMRLAVKLCGWILLPDVVDPLTCGSGSIELVWAECLTI